MIGQEPDFVTPNWDQPTPEPGSEHIWHVTVKKVDFVNHDSDKPFIQVSVVVSDQSSEFDGLEFDFRSYYSAKSKRLCIYFLKKFGYPNELLDCEQPRLSRSRIIGLQGKVWIYVQEGNHGSLWFETKGFERTNENELESRMDGTGAAESGAVIDLNADTQGPPEGEEDISWMDKY